MPWYPTPHVKRLIESYSGFNAPTGNIALSSFNRIVTWFGPWFKDQFSMIESERILTSEWYHGLLSKEAAIAKLLRMAHYLRSIGEPAKDVFLVRHSFKDPEQSPFTITVYRSETYFPNFRVTKVSPPEVYPALYSCALSPETASSAESPVHIQVPATAPIQFNSLYDYISTMQAKAVLGRACDQVPPDTPDYKENKHSH